ncbi:Hypothetical predicted protein [Mytilus galloprovincialis]|uniref:Uncharacterized protein n=1 Tax=Mytilus galloprovincialis TaxID=29158 RepID=A0A8B6HS49_MYTGA|nr:Hypothetical predicted protein [Mytilus galloprovincialis]
MDGFKLYVTNSSTIPPDGYLCYESVPGPPFPSTTLTKQCRQLGKYIIYYDNTGDYQFGPIIELCYVAITGCRKGMWGTGCSTTCPTVCIGHGGEQAVPQHVQLYVLDNIVTLKMVHVFGGVVNKNA